MKAQPAITKTFNSGGEGQTYTVNFAELGRIGGQKKTAKKKQSSQQNAAKARASRLNGRQPKRKK